MQELSIYQEYFNDEFIKVKKEYNREIFDKNAAISNFNLKERIYMSVIAEKEEVIERMNIETNTKQRGGGRES